MFSTRGSDVEAAEPRGADRPPSLLWVLLVIVLLAGIVTMHAVTLAAGHDSGHTVMAGGHEQMAATTHRDGRAAAADRSCPGDGCGNHHTALHACVFIMSMVGFVVSLSVLCWIGRERAQLALSWLRRCGRRCQRAPPWTVSSLAELSILRMISTPPATPLFP